MKKHYFILPLPIFLLILLLFAAAAQAQKPAKEENEKEKKTKKAEKEADRDMDFDEEGEEDTLNREIWEKVSKTPYERALRRAAKAKQHARPLSARAVLPNGWQIAPAGVQAEVGRLPFEAVAFAGRTVVLNTGYYSKEPQAVTVVNPETMLPFKVLHLAALYPSAAVSASGADLYISGGISQKIFRFDRNFKAVREYTVGGYAAGIAAIDDAHLAVVYMVASANAEDYKNGEYREGKIAILNTETGAVEREKTIGYFPQGVQALGGKLYVTVTGENKLQIFDLQLNLSGTLPTGARPQNMCADGRMLYVVNQNSDELTAVDTTTDRITATILVGWRESRFGAAPTSCAVENKHLYVTEANTNSVAVLDLPSNRMLGSVPAGFYPTKVLFQNGKMLVLSAKGVRLRRPNVDGPQPAAEGNGPDYVLTLLKGSLAGIPLAQIPADLPNWTQAVLAGTPLFDSRAGLKVPIKHIFYIVRENRTYDQVLGDLPRADGDPFLTLFGRETTPNAHKIAEDFVTLDNYYADGEISVLGHSFTTSGYASPFLEWIGNNAYAGRFSAYPFGTVPAVTSPAYLWDALDDKKTGYKIYGENYFLYNRAYRILSETYGADDALTRKFYAQMMSYATRSDRGNLFYQFAKPFYGQADTPEAAFKLLENPDFARSFSTFLCGDDSLIKPLSDNQNLRRRFAEYLAHYPSNYRSWDLKTSDMDRVAGWKTDFEKQLARGEVAPLSYLWLPNDHTGGIDKKYLPPEQLVAQNDAALALIIKTISKSPVWKDSLILVTEDDAQNGPDHVDATRTVALAAGPYVKRGEVVNTRYDQLSLLRTIELSLGLSPLNLNDALAVPMFDIFTAKPDFRPFEMEAPSKNLSAEDRQKLQSLDGGR